MPTNAVDVNTAHKKVTEDNAYLLDVRAPGEFASEHALGAQCVPLQDLTAHTDEIPRDRTVLVICQSGRRSEIAVTTLRSLGFNNVINVLGGTSAWQKAGLPIEAAEWECPLCQLIPVVTGGLVKLMRALSRSISAH